MTIYLGENIRRLRCERELTQERLAEFLGVTFQSVSNWERGESYPDITMLPEIAGFFKVTIDELMGIGTVEKEKELIEKLKEYDNLTDSKRMQEIVKELKEKYPNDFRVQIRQLACLVRFSENNAEIYSEVHSIYNRIQNNCTDDRIRIKSKRALIEYYRGMAENKDSPISFEDCLRIIAEMPDMRDSREMFCFYGKETTENIKLIRQTLEEQFLLLHTVYSHYLFYYEGFSDVSMLAAFKAELDFLNCIYDDGNYGKMWRTVIYIYGNLGVSSFKTGEMKTALEYFGKMCDLAIKFDNMDRITTMHSVMFEGNKFDKYTLGSSYVAKTHIKELLTEKYPLSEEFKATDGFKAILYKLS